MIACFKGIANLLAANSAIEKTELRFDIVELSAFSTIKLRYISWDVLFAFAMNTNHCSIFLKGYTGGTKGAFFLTSMKLDCMVMTEFFCKCDGLFWEFYTFCRPLTEGIEAVLEVLLSFEAVINFLPLIVLILFLIDWGEVWRSCQFEAGIDFHSECADNLRVEFVFSLVLFYILNLFQCTW